MKKLVFIIITLLAACIKYPEPDNMYISSGKATNVTATSATISGSAIRFQEAQIVQSGHCWSSANDVPDIIINQGKTELGKLPADGKINSYIGHLYPNTTYYVRAYVTNSSGTTIYSQNIGQFTTADTVADFPPNVATGTDSLVTSTSFLVKGTVVNTGSSPISDYGHCYSRTSTSPTIYDSATHLGSLSSPVSYTSFVQNLQTGITYYVRAYAKNLQGIAYGSIIAITTKNSGPNPYRPKVTTHNTEYYQSLESPLQTITLKGFIDTLGSPAISHHGFVYSANNVVPDLEDSVIDKGSASEANKFFYASPSFKTMKKYYYRAFASNANDTVYGAVYCFTTGPKQASLFQPREKAFAVALNNEMFIGGGTNQTDMMNGKPVPLKDFWKYTPSTDQWLQLSSIPSNYTVGANIFTHNNSIYVLCGGPAPVAGPPPLNPPRTEVWRYDPSFDSWTMVSSDAPPVMYGAGFMINSKYYIAGGEQFGYDTSFISGSLYEYDITTNTFTDYPMPNENWMTPNGLKGAVSFSINGKGYVAGGIKYTNSYDEEYSNKCWEFTPSTNTWQKKADIPFLSEQGATAWACAAVMNNKGYLITSNPYSDRSSPSYIIPYDPATDAWSINNDNMIEDGDNSAGFANGIAVSFNAFILTGTGRSYHSGNVALAKKIYMIK